MTREPSGLALEKLFSSIIVLGTVIKTLFLLLVVRGPTELQHGHSGILKKKGGEGSGAENGNQIGWQQMMEPGISMCCSSAEGRELLNYWSNLLLRSEFLQDEASLFTNESVRKASVRS